MSWNSVIATYDTKKKKAVKGLVNQRGNPITIISGNVIVKSVILEIKQKIDKPIVLVSNLKTHYDVENQNKVNLEYSPLHVFQVEEANQTKVVHIQDSMCINFCEQDEFSFELCDL